MKRGPKPLLGHTLTPAERQARYRAKQAKDKPEAKRPSKAVDRRSRLQRWRDTITELLALQSEYQAWLDALPENLADSPTAQALQAICDLPYAEFEGVIPPKGFGRD